MSGRAVLVLSGPIGAGKTSLGRALAAALGGSFLDSDDLRDHSRSWVAEALVVIDRIVAAARLALRDAPVLVVAKPLRARDWAVLRRRLAEAGHTAFCVTLAAESGAMLAPGRGRAFSPGEAARMAEMVAQGYASRGFSDLILRTDRAGFDETLAELEAGCRALMAGEAGPA